MKQTSRVCVNCGHGSLVRSNFKLLPNGKAFCIIKCSEAFEKHIYNENANARIKGDKVDD